MLLECSMSGYPITRNHPRDGYGEHQTHGDDLGAAVATQAELLTGKWVTTCMLHTAIHWWSVCWTWFSSGGYESTSHLADSYVLVHWCSQQQETFKPKWHKAPAEDGPPFIFTKSTSIPSNKFLHALHNLSCFFLARLNNQAIFSLSSFSLTGKKMGFCCGPLDVYVIPSPAT